MGRSRLIFIVVIFGAGRRVNFYLWQIVAKHQEITNPVLELDARSSVQALVSGLQIGKKGGRHQDRIIDCFDLIFVCHGTLPIQEEDRAFNLTAGQTLILWPHRHHWGNADFSLDLRLYWLHFTVHEKDESAQLDFGPAISVPQYADAMRPDVLEGFFRRFLDDQQSGRMLPQTADLLLRLILGEIADRRPVESIDEYVNGGAEALAERTLAYIHAYYHTALSVMQLSTDLGYNADYLNRIFRQTYQRTLLEEIQRTRINHAIHLLSHTPKKVADIAIESGFRDTNYFSRVFKRYQGTTPSAFRRLEQTKIP